MRRNIHTKRVNYMNKEEEKKDLSWLLLLFVIFVVGCLGHFGNFLIAWVHDEIADMKIWIIITAIAFFSLGYLSKMGYKVV